MDHGKLKIDKREPH